MQCKNCLKKITKPRPNQKFCNHYCRKKFGWCKSDPSKKNTFICEWCNKRFISWVYRPNRFCSAQCRSEFGARQPRPNNRKPEIHIVHNCRYCKNEYNTTTHQVRFRGSNFCSRKCQYAQISLDRRGSNNPNWAGGTADPSVYGENWNRQKRLAKHRDKHQCQVCGYKSGGNKYLDVHHIIPIKDFSSDWEKANKLTNLISLCRPCHVDVEKKRILCPTAT